jgi:hypothetical protein
MNALFAQGFGRTNAQIDPSSPEVLLFLGLVVVILLVCVSYRFTLAKALRHCRPANRAMEPGQVFLNLIPCFSVMWQFVTVSRIAQSLREEFRSRRRPINGDGGRGGSEWRCAR